MRHRIRNRAPRDRSHPLGRLTRKPLLPWFELLEERCLLDATRPIVVGRTLSSYFVGGIQNGQETITYTVFNQQANPETGVTLTTTLQPGITFASASAAPTQNGQQLTWNLGTVSGFGNASVQLTVTLASPAAGPLDGGASATGTLDGNAVSVSTAAAALRAGSVDPSLLAMTPDANTTNPYVQEKAAELGYDPNQIFNFLQNQIGYESYSGSLRGARRTLWSGAGNALDVASLGAALMRASGIPAQYAQGTLPDNLARQLILSMFPQPLNVVGCITQGTQTSDPVNNPQLLAETRDHFWFEFDTGNGLQDADPLVPGAKIGQSFAPLGGTFTAVPDTLDFSVEVKLNAEITNTASSLFGLSGQQVSTVLDQTFNAAALVGKSLSIGHFVNQSSVTALFTLG